MTENRYTGDTEIVLGGQPYTLRADWDAMAAAQEACQNPNALRSLYSLTTKQLSEVIAALLQRHHKGITAEWVREQSPAIVPTMESLNKAILFAYVGADGIAEAEAAAKKEAVAKAKSDNPKKK